jgi:hypothetical protein
MKIVPTRALTAQLIRLDLVPPNCAGVTFHIGVDGALILQYEIFITPDLLITLGDALATCGLQQLADSSEKGTT